MFPNAMFVESVEFLIRRLATTEDELRIVPITVVALISHVPAGSVTRLEARDAPCVFLTIVFSVRVVHVELENVPDAVPLVFWS